MSRWQKRMVDWAMRSTRLQYLPVRVRGGVAAGARWTLYPWTSYWRGTHERGLQQALMALNGGDIRGWSCWDLGAHFGLYSVGLARRVGPEGQVAAFEPNPLSFARLERHRRMNRLHWLRAYRAAVSDVAGEAEFYTYGDLGSTTTHLAYLGETRQAAAATIPVQTLRVDDLVRAGELRPPRFVKIDVEGHAHHALAGMRETLQSARPILIAAFHSHVEVDGVLGILDPLGYAATRVASPDPGSGSLVGGDYLFTPRG